MAKHYQNDYKKILGVDQSRTASQKLLDKISKKSEASRVAQKQQIQSTETGRKLVKKQQTNTQITEVQMFGKIKKTLLSNQNLKVTKGLNILSKCLQSGQHQSITTDSEHMSFIDIGEFLVGIDFLKGNKGSMAEQMQMGQKLVRTLNHLQQRFETHLRKQAGQEPQDKQQQKEQINQQIPRKQDCSRLVNQLKYKINLYSLLTDDNFCFQKHIGSLKEFIFLKMTQLTNESPHNQSQTVKQITLSVLLPIFQLPQLSLLDWVQSAIILFFKELIKQHRDQLALWEDGQKQILEKYNELLIKSNKNKRNFYGSSNSLATGVSQNKQVSGGSYNIVEKVDSQVRWFSKQ